VVPPVGSGIVQMISWDASVRAASSADEGRPENRTLAIAAAVTVTAFAIGGLVIAGLWVWFADPPYAVVQGDNAFRGSAELSRQFGIDVAFAAACLLVAVPLGAVVGLRGQRVGWPLVVVLVLAAVLASVIAWQVGGVLGPDNPRDLIAGAADGDRLYQQLDVHARGLFLTPPVGALVGFMTAVYLTGRPDRLKVPESDPERG
jgi:hypothetical protein